MEQNIHAHDFDRSHRWIWQLCFALVLTTALIVGVQFAAHANEETTQYATVENPNSQASTGATTAGMQTELLIASGNQILMSELGTAPISGEAVVGTTNAISIPDLSAVQVETIVVVGDSNAISIPELTGSSIQSEPVVGADNAIQIPDATTLQIESAPIVGPGNAILQPVLGTATTQIDSIFGSANAIQMPVLSDNLTSLAPVISVTNSVRIPNLNLFKVQVNPVISGANAISIAVGFVGSVEEPSVAPAVLVQPDQIITFAPAVPDTNEVVSSETELVDPTNVVMQLPNAGSGVAMHQSWSRMAMLSVFAFLLALGSFVRIATSTREKTRYTHKHELVRQSNRVRR